MLDERALRKAEDMGLQVGCTAACEIFCFSPLDRFAWSRINLPKELGRAPHLDYEHGGSLQRHVELHRNKVREQDLNFGHQSKCHDLPYDLTLVIVKLGTDFAQEV